MDKEDHLEINRMKTPPESNIGMQSVNKIQTQSSITTGG